MLSYTKSGTKVQNGKSLDASASKYSGKYILLPSTSGFHMMIKEEEGENGKQRREDTALKGF